MLWFAANQAVSSACKAKTYLKPLQIAPNVMAPSACEIAQERANQIKKMFPGIDWEQTDNNPNIQIIREPLDPSAKNAKPAAIFSRGNGAPLSPIEAPDESSNVYLCRVIIKGQIYPLVALPWFDIPGLSKPFQITVSSQAQYENLNGLTI